MIVEIWEILLFGAIISSLYAIISVGFTLLCSVGGFLDVTYSSFLMISAYLYLVVNSVLGLPALAFVVAVFGTACFASLYYKIIIRAIRKNPLLIYILSLLLAVTIEQVMIIIFSTSPKIIPPLLGGVIRIGGIKFPANLIFVIFLAWAFFIGLRWFIRNTQSGRAMRAVSMELEGAQLVGINLDKVQNRTYFIAGMLGAIGGVFYGSYTAVSPFMWIHPLIIMFAIVIVGGLGSIKGAITASVIIGYAEIITTYAWDPKGRGILALVAIILILLLRPKGLFGTH